MGKEIEREKTNTFDDALFWSKRTRASAVTMSDVSHKHCKRENFRISDTNGKGRQYLWSGGQHRHSLSYQEEVKAVQNHTVTEYVFREPLCDSVSMKQSLFRENFQISVSVKQYNVCK